MSKHTAGPWSYWQGAGAGDESHSEITAKDGDIVVAAFNGMIHEGEANARLMAAAPELLNALEQAVTSMQDNGYRNSHLAVRAARAAIARARGES